MSEDQALGPIDFVLLEFPDQEAPSGSAAHELRLLVDAGTIKLYDVVAIRKDRDGSFATFDVGDLSSSDGDSFAYFAGARSGLLLESDVVEAAATLDNGTVGIALVYENAWAGPFVAAARDSGGAVVASERVPAVDVITVLDELESE